MKIKIAIANTLKPVDDVRGFEKIAQSIAKTNKYQVNIIGNASKKASNVPSIDFIPHAINRRNFLSRLVLRAKILRTILKIKPSVFILQTHELLLIAILYKWITGNKIVYDVREDYRKNVRYLSSAPLPVRIILSRSIRLKERIATLFIDQFWLAEKCYVYEIGFPKEKSIVLENKAINFEQEVEPPKDLKCLFSGTISTYGGVLLAVEAFKEIQKQDQKATLTIIGQCHDSQLAKALNSISNSTNNIELLIAKNPIPHSTIISHILSSTLGLISYQENHVNKNKVPTKLYEYSKYGLPYLIQKDTTWESKGIKLGGAIPVDYANLDVRFILKKHADSQELFHVTYPENETWESQESKLFTSLDTLLE